MSICDVKFGHRIMEAVGLFEYKMRKCAQITLILQTGETRVLSHDFWYHVAQEIFSWIVYN